MKEMSVSQISYQHHRDLNHVFEHHKHLIDSGILRGAYKIDYTDDYSTAIITLDVAQQDGDSGYAQRVKPQIERLEKSFLKYFRKQGMQCQVKRVFVETNLAPIDSAVFERLKVKLSKLQTYNGKYQTSPVNPRQMFSGALDHFRKLSDAESIARIRRELILLLFGCLMPAVTGLTAKHPKLGRCCGLIDNLIDFRDLIGVEGSNHMMQWVELRRRMLMSVKPFFGNRRADEVMIELVKEEIIELPKLRPTFRAELMKLPYSPESLEIVNPLLGFIAEFMRHLNEINRQAEEVYEYVVINDIALHNAAIMFDPSNKADLDQVLGVDFQPEYQAFVAKGYANAGKLKPFYQRYKTYYAVLHKQLEPLYSELTTFQKKTLLLRSAFQNCMRLVRRHYAQKNHVDKVSAPLLLETPAAYNPTFLGPLNQSATKESKQSAASLASQIERKRQSTLFAERTVAVAKEQEVSASTWLQLCINERFTLSFDLATGCDEQGAVVAIRVAPTLQYPVYVSLFGVVELTEPEMENLRQQQGRDFLTKTGRGANGLKLFGDSMLGFKTLKQQSRVVFVGLPIPGNLGWCYVPLNRVGHSKWESLQPDSQANRQSWQEMRKELTLQVTLSILENVDAVRANVTP